MEQKVFISHSSKNAWLLVEFMYLIKSANPDVIIFCSADESAIEIADEFKKVIYKSLRTSDIFVAIVSEEYWKSKYCIFELGAAYERYCDNEVNSAKIVPLLLPPLNKGQALANTPLVEMQIADLTNEASVAMFLKHFTDDESTIRNLNVAIGKFCTYVKKHILEQTSLYDGVNAGAFFDERGKLKVQRNRIVRCRRDGDAYEFTFNLSLLDYDDPSFASVALMYQEDKNMRDYLKFDKDASFCFTVDNRNRVLNDLTVEFKSSSYNRTYFKKTELTADENEVRIPLAEMNYEPLERISEICFVIHPSEMNGLDGEVVFSNIRVDFTAKNILENE